MPTTTRRSADVDGPGLVDALSLLSEVADELVVRTVRDTHLAWAGRVHGLTRRTTGPAAAVPELVHRSIATAVYAGLSAGFRAASRGLDTVGATGVGPRLEENAAGRFLASAVNGLIGDRLQQERPHMAIPMAVRAGGHDVPLDSDALAVAFPAATGRVAVLLHGLCENESHWERGREQVGSTYVDTLADLGWTPVLLRANTGLGLRENGAALTALLQHLVEQWPVRVEEIALVGHSMGGLVMRAAAAVASGVEEPWSALVTDVVTLGTPHLGAPLARHVGHGSRGMAVLPETAAFGRILDWRSLGVHDLVAGLAEDVPPLPHARYHLVAATLTRTRRHPVGHMVGDMLVRPESAYGRDPSGRRLFPGADVLHVGGTGHFGLLNHPDVHAALRRWLA